MQEETQNQWQGLLFALCESRYGTASLLRCPKSILGKCPACSEESLEFIPLADNESYRLRITEDSGVEFHFSLKQSATRYQYEPKMFEGREFRRTSEAKAYPPQEIGCPSCESKQANEKYRGLQKV
jgi:hypothetical protein